MEAAPRSTHGHTCNQRWRRQGDGGEYLVFRCLTVESVRRPQQAVCVNFTQHSGTRGVFGAVSVPWSGFGALEWFRCPWSCRRAGNKPNLIQMSVCGCYSCASHHLTVTATTILTPPCLHVSASHYHNHIRYVSYRVISLACSSSLISLLIMCLLSSSSLAVF